MPTLASRTSFTGELFGREGGIYLLTLTLCGTKGPNAAFLARAAALVSCAA